MHRIRVIDSHTEGEPTRVVVEGLPALSTTNIKDKVDELRTNYDGLRSGIVCEPRGHDAVVGAYLLSPPSSSEMREGSGEGDIEVIFFNNAKYLGMCGHGTIGVVATLAYLGKIEPGEIQLNTPVGPIRARLHEDGRVT